MSREVKKDFKVLKNFITKYSLESFEKESKLVEYLSQMHKKYYSLIALIYELKELDSPSVIEGKQQDFLLEALSDIGNSIFLSINGAYKSSRLMMRSAIETFSKGIIIDEITNIDQEKKIFKMFESIKDTTFFLNEPNKELLSNLTTLYSELSKDIHTANKDNMQHTSSLNYFPTKSKSSMKKISSINSNITTSFITLLCLRYNKEFHKIHHSNKQIIIDSIPKSYRKLVMNIE